MEIVLPASAADGDHFQYHVESAVWKNSPYCGGSNLIAFTFALIKFGIATPANAVKRRTCGEMSSLADGGTFNLRTNTSNLISPLLDSNVVDPPNNNLPIKSFNFTRVESSSTAVPDGFFFGA